MILSIKSQGSVCSFRHAAWHGLVLSPVDSRSWSYMTSDYFHQSAPLSTPQALLRQPSCFHKAKRVHNPFLYWQVRRWIKSPMVSVEKHPHTSLKYPGSTVMHLPSGDSELEPPLCQTCLSDHPFQRGIASQEAESCSWESQRSTRVSRSLLPPSPPNFVYMFHTDNGSVLRRLCFPWRGESPKSETADQGPCAHLSSAFCLELWYPRTARNKGLFTEMLWCSLTVSEQISSNAR